MSKQNSLRRVNRDAQRKARRQLVVLLSGLLFVLLPLYPAVMLTTKLAIWLGIGSTLQGLEPVFLIVALSSTFLIGAVISSVIWMLIMSSYLTIEEWQELERSPSLRIPYITPLFALVARKVLTWKLNREK